MRQRELMTAGMLLQQAARSVTRRPGRAAGTALGIAVGIAVYLTTVGLSLSASAAVNATFDEVAATEIAVSDNREDPATSLFDATFDQDVQAVIGVVAGGQLWALASGVVVARSGVVGAPAITTSLLVVSPGALDAVGAVVGSGRLYDSAGAIAGPVAVLGPRAARDLGVSSVQPGVAVVIGDRPIPVVGVLSDVGSAAELGSAVLLPPASADLIPGYSTVGVRQGGVVRTVLGGAGVVASALPVVIRPEAPERVGVLVPPDPTELRGQVQMSLDGLTLAIAGLAMAMGGIAIFNALLASVAQRAGEIGLRRALGASPRHVVAQFLAEGGMLGLGGAVVGTALGLVALVVTAHASGWQPVLAPGLAWAAPLVGTVVGLVASVYPARRAARLRPAESLRR